MQRLRRTDTETEDGTTKRETEDGSIVTDRFFGLLVAEKKKKERFAVVVSIVNQFPPENKTSPGGYQAVWPH